MLKEALRTEVVTITPALAAEWLERNHSNRSPRAHHINRLGRSMERNEWRVTGEAIKFDEDGNLVDGQHRLLAVVQTGVSIESLVVWGVRDESQIVMDTGSKRTFADYLKMQGETNTLSLAAIVRAVWLYDHGGIRGGTLAPSHDEMRELFWSEEHRFRSACIQGMRLQQALKGPVSIYGMCFVLFDRIDAEESLVFCERLARGVGLEEDDPLITLRRWLTNQMHLQVERTRKASPIMHAAVTIKAWNAWREGRPLTRLVWRPGGAHPEPFPKPM